MTTFLGQLVWWKVGDPKVHGGDLTGLLQDLGFTVRPPRPSQGVDVFRRLTGAKRKYTYDLPEGRTGELTIHLVNSRQPDVLRRDIVHRVLDDKGVALDIWKVGDATFIKPKAGSNQKGRMQVRVTDLPVDLAEVATREIHYFADQLRQEYAIGLDHLDPQGVRRLVRGYLASVDAVYLNGPYFIADEKDAGRLIDLLAALGDPATFGHMVGLVDTPGTRQLVQNYRNEGAEDDH